MTILDTRYPLVAEPPRTKFSILIKRGGRSISARARNFDRSTKTPELSIQQDRTLGMRRSARKFLIFRILTGFPIQYRYRISTSTPVKIRVYTCVHSCVCVRTHTKFSTLVYTHV